MKTSLLEQQVLGIDEALIPRRQHDDAHLIRMGLVFYWRPINPFLDGEVTIERGSRNTTVLNERLPLPGGDILRNTYIHHDQGPGRMETNIVEPRPIENPFLPKPKPPQY